MLPSNPTASPPLGEAAATEEARRLRAVASYQPAGTTGDANFDQFAALAADLLNLPIGLVNLVGSEEVTVQGRFGLEISSVPRLVAFCDHTVRADAVLAVPDLAVDARFAGNPLVVGEPSFRFYAGTPLISPRGGERIGTLCVLGHQPRPTLDPREARLIESLASLAMDRLELRRAEGARNAAETRFERMTAATPEAVVCADMNGVITHWNPAAQALFGWTAGEAIGQALSLIVPDTLRGAHDAGMARMVTTGEVVYSGRTVELPALRRDGSTFPAEVTLASWHENGSRVFGASIHDITIRRAGEDRLRVLVHRDALTGCASRAKLMELIGDAASANRAASLVLLDLDGFKQVNDTLGHAIGDELLREVGRRLVQTLGERGEVARLGGDEFAAWLPGRPDLPHVETVTRELLAALTPPHAVGGRLLRVGASAGVALAAVGGAATLLADADFALYRAKSTGRGSQRTYDMALREEQEAKLALGEEVHDATLSGQFELHYQPQISLRTGRLIGAEALLRWRHPDRGLLLPAAFLPALEAGPLSGLVGDWAIDEGCRQAAAWRDQGLSVRVGVNLFTEQLRAGTLETVVLAALRRWKLPPQALELELTETIVLGNDSGQMSPLRALRAHGVGLAFDDFGTGFASLSTLKSCPLTRLKIDRGFVSGLGVTGVLGRGRDREDVAIIEAVLALARGLGLSVVAEGVETEAQSAFLAGRGCDEGQGYLYGRPTPAALLPLHAPVTGLMSKRRRLAFKTWFSGLFGEFSCNQE